MTEPIRYQPRLSFSKLKIKDKQISTKDLCNWFKEETTKEALFQTNNDINWERSHARWLLLHNLMMFFYKKNSDNK